jgi:hypothetical protein
MLGDEVIRLAFPRPVNDMAEIEAAIAALQTPSTHDVAEGSA